MRSPSTPDCSISGCRRAAHKGFLCAKHYKRVPLDMRRETMWRAIEAELATARKWHRKQLAYVRRALREDSQATGRAEAS